MNTRSSGARKSARPTALPVDPTLLDALNSAAPGSATGRSSTRLAMAHDASHYLLTPQAVLTPNGIDELAALIRVATQFRTPITFRSGGTSLSGQAGTNHLLVDTRRHFRDITVIDDGTRVVAQPGATVRQVNTRLAPYGRKLGPDPASEAACTIGGIIANNSSGMACGTEFNTYQTLESAVLLLPSGTILDTGDPDCNQRLAYHEPELYEGLLRLKNRIEANQPSVATIRQQFSLKNTMGYGLNSFLDYTHPIDMLLHLVVGSEGTLAFIAQATFRTIPIRAHAATGLLVFSHLRYATDALPDLIGTGLATIELLDATSLRVAQLDPQADAVLRGLAVDQHAALLVEYQENTVDELTDRVAGGARLLDAITLAVPPKLSSDARARAALWHIRKGLYATVAGNRPTGTTALLEDIAVPVQALADTCAQLTNLFARHGYDDSVIFGHAKDGNIHFLLNERFDQAGLLERYAEFTEDMVELVLGHHGTLKAEHGTGRIMTPFVKRQYGDELYQVMRELKSLYDPGGILNPGSILNDDPNAHIAHLKTTPSVEAEVDRCVECGYCEPVCPSKDLTLTPRQRIVLRREIATASQSGDTALEAELRADYQYDGIETCAADGMCQTACPVLIDTGQLIRRLRSEQHRPLQERPWASAATQWEPVTRAAAAGLSAAQHAPHVLTTSLSSAGRRLIGHDTVPAWTSTLPPGGRARSPITAQHPDIVYFPSCTGAMFGSPNPGGGVSASFLQLCQRSGITVRTPDRIGSLCCGTPWKSKGFDQGHKRIAKRTLEALWGASEHGRLPVICDASSCTEGLNGLTDEVPAQRLQMIDSTTYTSDRLLPRLKVSQSLASITIHPTCSSTRLDSNAALISLATAIADEIYVPPDWGCCAFAGDRGLLHPELTASATAPEAAQMATFPTSVYASTNQTCQIGMTRATGHPYRHIVELVEEATR